MSHSRQYVQRAKVDRANRIVTHPLPQAEPQKVFVHKTNKKHVALAALIAGGGVEIIHQLLKHL